MKQDQLHQLLRSLTKSEKRYFQLFSKRSGENDSKNYLHLFDVLDSMEEYDEEKLILELEKRNVNTKFLAADKNYLYRSVLNALRSFNSISSAKQKVRRYLDFVEILVEKGLIRQANKILRKAKNIAEGEDALEYLLEILQIERKIGGRILSLKALDKKHAEMELGLEKIRNLNEYEFFYRKSNIIRVQIGKTRDAEKLKELSELTSNQYIANNEPSCFAAEKWNLQAKATSLYIKDETEKELDINQSLLNLMKNLPKYVKSNPFEYISVFSRVLILSKEISPDVYPELLKQFLCFADVTHKGHRKVKARVYSIAYSTEMVSQLKAGLYEEGLKLIDGLEKLMNSYGDIIDPAFCLNNYYKFAYFNIGVDNYEAALENLNHLINEFSSKLRPDIFGYAKILTCICHYELGNVSLLPHLSDTTKYFLRKEKRLFEFEKLFLQSMRNLPKMTDVKDHFLSLQTQINKNLPQDKRGEQNYFDFDRWIEAKKLGITFSQVGVGGK